MVTIMSCLCVEIAVVIIMAQSAVEINTWITVGNNCGVKFQRREVVVLRTHCVECRRS